ncbi:CARDB domain-containing protein [Natrialbaceae archaeon A-chndr2]
MIHQRAQLNGQRTIVLAAIVVLTVAALSMAIAGTAANPDTQTPSITPATEATQVADAERTIADQTLEPGDSTTVTVTIATDSTTDPALIESIDTGFATIEGLEATPDTTTAAIKDDHEALVAVWEETDSVTATYTVSVDDDVEPGTTYAITGDVETAAGSVPVAGDTTITVVETDRSIAKPELEPGESTNITVTAATEADSSVALLETVHSDVTDLEVTSAEPLPTIQAVKDDNEAVVAVWETATEVDLTYEVTVAESATPGSTVTIDGTLETEHGTMPVGGPMKITVIEPTADDDEDDEDEKDPPYVPSPSPDPATFELSVSPSTMTLNPGETQAVEAEVTNVGEAPGTATLSLVLEDDRSGERAIELDGGESRSVSFTLQAPDEPGTYAYHVLVDDEQHTGTLQVEADETADDSDDDPVETDDGVDSDDSGDEDADTPPDEDATDPGYDDSATDDSIDSDAGDEADDVTTDQGPTESTDDTIPGFGIVVALIALGIVPMGLRSRN